MKELVQKEIDNGVSRRRLASLVGVSLGTVQNVLLGDTEIKNSTLEKFSRYFRMAPGSPIIKEAVVRASDQVTVRDILKLHEAINDLAAEIGRIKDRMLDAAQSGEIHRLGIIGGKGK